MRERRASCWLIKEPRASCEKTAIRMGCVFQPSPGGAVGCITATILCAEQLRLIADMLTHHHASESISVQAANLVACPMHASLNQFPQNQYLPRISKRAWCT